MKNTVKSRLLDLLKTSGMTENQLAKASGVEYTTIHRICSGDTASPSKNTLLPIAKALSVSVDYLHSGIIVETEISLLQKTFEEFRLQLRTKDALIEKLVNKLMGTDATGSFRQTLKEARLLPLLTKQSSPLRVLGK